jgi:hypothetical protein
MVVVVGEDILVVEEGQHRGTTVVEVVVDLIV